jgi:UDP-N-acetylmuramoyl-tripeptide--D-alanyl-D-alanine ligase
MNSVSIQERKIERMLTVTDIIAATGGKVVRMTPDSFTGISIDSRKTGEGELFIALRGSRFDGHDFLGEALKTGAGAIVSLQTGDFPEDKTIIHVKDTLKALQDIAHFMRLKRGVPVVGITGSNGKTTTKEITASVLSTAYRVLKNTGNLNNSIGLPLSLTKISDEDEVVVLEMGASASGEIRELCDIAVPNYGVLTNVSPSHLEGFGDLATVRKTKLEILDTVNIAVVNADDLFMMEGIRGTGFKGMVVTYGIKNQADISASEIRLHEEGSSFILRAPEGKPIEISPKISGIFNIYNVLAAAAVGYLFHIDPADMKKSIDSFEGVPMRLEFRDWEGTRVISDVYNANPASMEEALKELVRTRGRRAIAVLGDMLELGAYEEEAHRKIGRLLSELGVEIFITVGPRMALAASEFKGVVHTLSSASEAGRLLSEIRREGDTILIKGSRAMHMEKVLEA